MAGFRSEGLLGLTYIEQQREQVFKWISVARTAAIPVAMYGTYLIWQIGRRLFSNSTGVLAATLWSFSPTVLTFGASITPDVTAAVFGLLAAWRFYIWLAMGTVRNSVWLGLVSGLAMLSKASWLILPPVFIAITLVYGLLHLKRWQWLNRLRQGALVAAVSWLSIHAAYEFEGTLVPLGHFEFVSQTLTGIKKDDSHPTHVTGNRFQSSWVGYLPAPLPAAYIRGIDIQKHDFESKMTSYFFGQWRDHGWWYYYIVGMWLKEPIALWLMVLIGSVMCRTHGLRSGTHSQLLRRLIVFTPGTVLLVFVSSQTGFNHHLRYVLPFLPCFYLLVASGVARFNGYGRFIVIGLAAMYTMSSLSVLPRSYSYFTEVIGGPSHGWKYIGDSNFDWGQDILTVKWWLESNPDKRPAHIIYSIPLIDYRKLGIDAEEGQQSVTPNGPTRPGWWIVFARPLLATENIWFREHEPTERLSVTTSVYLVSEADIRSRVLNTATEARQ